MSGGIMKPRGPSATALLVVENRPLILIGRGRHMAGMPSATDVRARRGRGPAGNGISVLLPLPKAGQAGGVLRHTAVRLISASSSSRVTGTWYSAQFSKAPRGK